MATRSNKRQTPLKINDDEDCTPSKSHHRSSRSSSRGKSCEIEDNADTTSHPKDASARRSTRISERGIKIRSAKSVDSLVRDASSADEDWIYDKPMTNFFNENPDDNVHRYSFKTPKKRDGMVTLAHNTPKRNIVSEGTGTPNTPKTPNRLITPKTPKTQRTPKSSRKLVEPKTPRNLRAELKKGLKKICNESIDEEEDFVHFEDSGDEYKPLESSNSEDDEDVDESKQVSQPTAKTSYTRTTRFSTRQQQDFVFESDKYFGHTNKKNATSDNTLDCLKTPRLQYDEIFKLLASHEISQNHQNCIRDLQRQYETFFPKWMFLLREGFTILLHGLGSKRNILQRLHKTFLAHENVLVVNGYFPSLSIKEMLEDIVTGVLETTCKSKNLYEIVDVIEEEFRLTPEFHFFLIIHNLDGTMLRNDTAQNILSRLAHIANVHLIASIDHINAPNLWDNIQLSNYNFSWWDVTSFLPYTDETSVAENSMLLKNNSGALTIASMKSVLLSLTQNARGIYMIIVDNQLASNKSSNYQGIPFKNLYKKCLENFFVSSDIVLRTQLTEFCDHNLLKLKRTTDGTEQLKIPIDNILLQQFVEQYNNWQL